mgnify:CR=1 FL=1
MKLRDLVLFFVSYSNNNCDKSLSKRHSSRLRLFGIQDSRDIDLRTIDSNNTNLKEVLLFYTFNSNSISIDYNSESRYIEIRIPYNMDYYLKIDLDDIQNNFDETAFILKHGRKLTDEYLSSNIKVIYDSIDDIIGLIEEC